MTLSEAMEADTTAPGGRCPVRVLVDGGIPTGSSTETPLEAEDRETLAAITAPGSGATLSKAHRYLIGVGYKVGSTALGAHRRGDCACGR